MVNKRKKEVIDGSNASLLTYLQEVIKYKDLLYTFTIRDYRVRYSQSFLGVLWAFLQPFCTVLILVLVFDHALHVPTNGVPYPLYAMAGMSLWTYFAFVLNQSGTSILSSQSMISKVYFPRLIIPFSKAILGVIDFMVSFAMFLVLLLYYQYSISFQFLFLPVFLLLTFVASFGAGILFCSVSLRYRDFQYVIPFVIQFGLYVSPIAYPASFISEKFKWLYFLNPMAGAIEGFRWSVFHQVPFDPYILLSFLSAFTLFILGMFLFNRMEKDMADLV